MAPFDVTYREVPDERLSELLGLTNAAGFGSPTMTPAAMGTLGVERPIDASLENPFDEAADLPEIWATVREMPGQSYAWPEEREFYDEYRVYAGETQRAGTVHLALGKKDRRLAWDAERMHVVVFLTSGSPQVPVVEFQGTDDFEDTRELVSVIRGLGGAKSKKMFGPGDPLPPVYAERFRTTLYSERIRVRGAWGKVAVIAREDEPDAILNHALIQARRRGDI